MNFKKIFVITPLILFDFIVSSQEKQAFVPSGAPTFKIFSNYHSTFSDGKVLMPLKLQEPIWGTSTILTKTGRVN